jgi:hypothetical protein
LALWTRTRTRPHDTLPAEKVPTKSSTNLEKESERRSDHGCDQGSSWRPKPKFWGKSLIGLEWLRTVSVAELTLPLQLPHCLFSLFSGIGFLRFACPQQQRRARRVSQSQFAPLPLDDPFSRQGQRLALISWPVLPGQRLSLQLLVSPPGSRAREGVIFDRPTGLQSQS